MSGNATERVDTLDELEVSVHHRVKTECRTHEWDYEIHAGTADVIEVPKALAEMAKTVVGVDLQSDNIRCGAEIRVIDDE